MKKSIRFLLSVITVFLLSACNLGSSTPAVINPDATPALALTKQATNAGDTFNTVGQTINYTYVVNNTGQTALSGPVTINDDKIPDITCPDLITIGNLDGLLDPNESITCSKVYSITQADLDAGTVTNSATASAGGATSNNSPITVTMTQNKALTLTKNANPLTYNQAGQVITYTYTIKNTGNVTLQGPFSITDNKATATCTPPANDQLPPNGEMTCTSTYLITQIDLTTSSVTNSATASGGGTTSNTTTATVTNSGGEGQPITQVPGSGNYTPGTTVQHVVADGDWMVQIARCYGAYYQEVRLANPQIIEPRLLKPGEIVNVPRVGSVGTVFGPPCVVFHTVQAGETWNSIASAYNADLLVLQEANPGALTPGRVLKVPRNSAGAFQYTPQPPIPTQPVRLTIPSGQDSVSVTNTLTFGSIRYVLFATQGQVMNVQLTATPGQFTLGIIGPNNTVLKPADTAYTWVGTLAASGDYYFDITSILGDYAKTYTLTISLTLPK